MQDAEFVSERVDISLDTLVAGQQVHGTKVEVVTKAVSGRGFFMGGWFARYRCSSYDYTQYGCLCIRPIVFLYFRSSAKSSRSCSCRLAAQ